MLLLRVSPSLSLLLLLPLSLCIIFLCLVRCDVPKEDKGNVDWPNKQRLLKRGGEGLGLRPLWRSYVPKPQLHAAPPGKKKGTEKDGSPYLLLPH